MNRLRKHSSTLKVLKTAKPIKTKAIIGNGDKELVNVLCECAHNVLKGNVPLTHHQKRKLQSHKKTLRCLSSRRKLSLVKKKKLLQKGGFLGALLGPVLGILGGLLNK